MTLSIVFVKIALSQTDEIGRHFDEFVIGDVVDRLFEGEFARRGEDDVLIAAGGADVGELLRFGRIDDDVVVARMFADNHPFIDFIARFDKERSPLLQIEEGIAIGFAGAVGDQNAAAAAGHIPFPRSKGFEDGSEDAKARGAGEKVVPVAHESARGDEKLHRGEAML